MSRVSRDELEWKEVGLGVLTVPVTAVWSAEEEVLHNNHDPVPEDDLASEYGLVERRHLAWGLAVEFRQPEVDKQSDAPEE